MGHAHGLRRNTVTKLTHPLSVFVGRQDCFAVQQPSGAYLKQDRPLTDGDLEEHEAGLWSIGTYTITPEDNKYMVKHIVFDLDVYDKKLFNALVLCAGNMIDPFESNHPWLVIEDSGGKGYHIWLILDKPIEAWRARAWVNDCFMPEWVAKTDNATLEIFPKQDSISEGGYGNLTKLPLGVHAKSGNRSQIISVPFTNTAPSYIVEGYPTSRIPAYEKPTRLEGLTPATVTSPTGMLLKDGPVSDLLRGTIAEGSRNQAFYSFFTWCAWNIRLPMSLAWDWWGELNAALPNPEDRIHEAKRTMESAYARPPADAATLRQRPQANTRRASIYRVQPLSERLESIRQGS